MCAELQFNNIRAHRLNIALHINVECRYYADDDTPTHLIGTRIYTYLLAVVICETDTLVKGTAREAAALLYLYPFRTCVLHTHY